jgi:predicted nucleotidyltransferase
MEHHIDPDTARAVRAFLDRLPARYDVAGAILFGSRARHDHRPDSDADVLVLLRGLPSDRIEASMPMSELAFDVLLETGVLVQAVPIWESEWEHPEQFNNPALLRNVRAEGVPL